MNQSTSTMPTARHSDTLAMTISKLLMLYALLAEGAHASVAYSNTTNDLFTGINFLANDLVEAGDQVTLIPGSHLLTQVAIDVFNVDLDVSTSATLRLYHVTGSALGALFTGCIELNPEPMQRKFRFSSGLLWRPSANIALIGPCPG